MFKKRFTVKAAPLTVVLASTILISSSTFARSNVYADFPVTLKDYSGSATTSVLIRDKWLDMHLRVH